MTIIERLKNKDIDPCIEKIAKQEKTTVEFIVAGLLSGEIVIAKNISRDLKSPRAFGKGLSTKINANIGTSNDHVCLEEELKKVEAAVRLGADAVMDLSTGGELAQIRKDILVNCPVPLGTVPIYQAVKETVDSGKKITDLDFELLFDVIEQQAAEGVDFMTIHCGVNRATTSVLARNKRIAGVVSRGGSFLNKWIEKNNRENPLYEEFDRLLKIAKKYDVTLSLGDGLRPGCLADASDAAQMAELAVLGELVLRSRKADVQVMVEGPGHMPLDQIQPHVIIAKRLIHNAPYYVLGPLVTDVAAGYDHITSAIGGAIAASAGADFLCYVTPAEHIRLPGIEDVKNGVVASRIAAHAADIAKKVPGAREWDDAFSRNRKALDWNKQQEMALDSEHFASERKLMKPQDEHVCTMCGKYCAMKD
jgi:phosphomethylpyrimidine synthase